MAATALPFLRTPALDAARRSDVALPQPFQRSLAEVHRVRERLATAPRVHVRGSKAGAAVARALDTLGAALIGRAEDRLDAGVPAAAAGLSSAAACVQSSRRVHDVAAGVEVARIRGLTQARPSAVDGDRHRRAVVGPDEPAGDRDALRLGRRPRRRCHARSNTTKQNATRPQTPHEVCQSVRPASREPACRRARAARPRSARSAGRRTAGAPAPRARRPARRRARRGSAASPGSESETRTKTPAVAGLEVGQADRLGLLDTQRRRTGSGRRAGRGSGGRAWRRSAPPGTPTSTCSSASASSCTRSHGTPRCSAR